MDPKTVSGEDTQITPEEKEAMTQRIAELEKLVADKETTNSNLVNELKELRTKKGVTEGNPGGVPDGKTPEEIEKVVAESLAKRDAEAAKANLDAARQKFLENNKEFHPDSDPGGIKFSALQKEFDSLKTDGASSQEDFLRLFDKALRLVNPAKAIEKVHLDASMKKEGGNPSSVPQTKLSDKELQLIKNVGWSEERYLKLKAEQPAYVTSLLDKVK